jgi:NAD(P)-dependent dehydrogenase (short-subunit alcohol dehydrogenase family)
MKKAQRSWQRQARLPGSAGFSLPATQIRERMMAGEFGGTGVIVSGGATGIGEAVARAFLREGARVCVGDVDRDRGERLIAELDEQHPGAVFFAGCDVSEPDQIAVFVSLAADRLGRIGVLVNCAGVISHLQPEEITPERWQQVLDINLRGAFLLCQAVAPLMRAGGGGAIVNLSSACVRTGGVATGADYVAAKGGIAALTLHLGKRWAGDGIRVNAVSPGVIDTRMTAAAGEAAVEKYLAMIPMRRLGTPTEVAEAVLFLASPRASYITAATLEVTGGF